MTMALLLMLTVVQSHRVICCSKEATTSLLFLVYLISLSHRITQIVECPSGSSVNAPTNNFKQFNVIPCDCLVMCDKQRKLTGSERCNFDKSTFNFGLINFGDIFFAVSFPSLLSSSSTSSMLLFINFAVVKLLCSFLWVTVKVNNEAERAGKEVKP